MTCVRCRSSSFVHHKVSGSDISRTVWPWIFYRHIHTHIVYSRVGHDVTNNFRSDVRPKKSRKCHLRWLRMEFPENGLSEDHQIFYKLIGDYQPHIASGYDGTSCFRSAAKCNKILQKKRKTGAAGQRVEFGHCLTQNHQIVHGRRLWVES